MFRFLSSATWLCTTLGLVMLICSVVLVPNHVLIADDGGGGGGFFCVPLFCTIPCLNNHDQYWSCLGTGCYCKCIYGPFGYFICE